MNETKPQTIRAVVGSQLSRDEEIFGSLYDRKVIRRFASYVRPYRRSVIIAIGSVLIYTTAQMLIPLIIQSVIDHAIIEKKYGNGELIGQGSGDGGQAHRVDALPLGTSEMAGQDHPGAFRDQFADGGKGGVDTSLVGDGSVRIERNVEIHTD